MLPYRGRTPRPLCKRDPSGPLISCAAARGGVMNPNERDELIRCGLNQTYTVRPSNRQRCQVIQGLVRQGYMIPISEAHNLEYEPRPFYMLPKNTTVTLTGKGRAWLLALDPADFEGVAWWPLPSDIRHLQKRIRKAKFWGV